MAVANGAGVEFAFAEGDGLVVEVKISRLQLISGRFFPVFELLGIEIRRE